MPDGIYAALSGAIANERALEVTANNLANVSTTGFKGDRIAARSQFAQELERQSPVDQQVAIDVVRIDMRQGGLHETGNPLDVAAANEGFFVVKTPEGDRYTRAGHFVLDQSGRLMTPDGNAVMGEGGPIDIGVTGSVRILDDGSVVRDSVTIDRLKMVRFDDPTGLQREGGTTFSEGTQTPQTLEAAVHAGFVEQSNVSPVRGMTDLISISRSHELMHRAIELFREVDQKTTNDLGR